MCFSGSAITLNVEFIVCVLCIEDTLVQECNAYRVGEGGSSIQDLIIKSNQSLA